MFPEHAMLAFRQAFDRASPYTVPEWVDLRESKVEYTFASKSSELVFTTPARHFLCDEYRQGLIWECDPPPRPEEGEEPPVPRCVLGLVRHGILVLIHMEYELMSWEELLSLCSCSFTSSKS